MAGEILVQVHLNVASSKNVSVPVIPSGSAVQGEDYTLLTALPVTIPAGSTSAEIRVSILNDVTDEEDETITLTMGSPSNATLGSPSAHTITVTNSTAPPSVSFTASAQAGAENSGTLAVTVQLSAASSLEVRVPFSVGGTATQGIDYSLLPSTQVVIPAGSASAQILITVINDAIDEDVETLTLTLGTPVNAVKHAFHPYRHDQRR
jgi:hypothetical protein